MNLRPRRAEDPELNLISLVDVVLLLLIFFMVSTTFRKEVDLEIVLPEASQKPGGAVERQELEVAIDAQGRYSVNGQALADDRLTTLRQALAEAAGARRDLPLVIRADGRTPHQAVVRAMDAAGLLGFKRIAIATVHAPAGDAPAPER